MKTRSFKHSFDAFRAKHCEHLYRSCENHEYKLLHFAVREARKILKLFYFLPIVLRQYKNDSVDFKKLSVLKLSLFLSPSRGWKSTSISRVTTIFTTIRICRAFLATTTVPCHWWKTNGCNSQSNIVTSFQSLTYDGFFLLLNLFPLTCLVTKEAKCNDSALFH